MMLNGRLSPSRGVNLREAWPMGAGGILLTVSTGNSPHAAVLMLIIVQAVFGFGVGGEFPVAASSASERAEETHANRGCTVQLVFAMQVCFHGLLPD